MAIESRIVCDVCGAQKRSVNHWWKIKLIAGANGKTGHLRVYPASHQVLNPYKDVCGQSCAHRMMDKWMETGIPEISKEKDHGEN